MDTAFLATVAVGSIRGVHIGAASQSAGVLTAAVRRANVGAFQLCGEALGGAFIAIVGLALWLW